MWPLFAQHDAGGSGLQGTIDSLARTPLSQIVMFVAICSLVRLSLYTYLKKTVPHRRTGGYLVAKFVNEAMDAIIYAGVFVFMIIRPFAVQAFLIPSGSMLQTLWVNDFIVANKAIYRYTEPKFGDIIVFRPPDIALNKGQTDLDFIKRCIGTPGDLVEVRNGKLWRNGKSIDEPYLSDSPGEGADGNGHAIAQGKDVPMNCDWKLIRYMGSARPSLDGQYVPVQIRRPGGQPPSVPGQPTCNYGEGVAIAHPFAVGDADGADPLTSWVSNWKVAQDLSADDWKFEKELEQSPPVAVPKGYVLMMGDNRNNSYDGRAWGLVPRDDVVGRSEFIWLPVSRWRVTR